jgi:hypothetical protein
VGSLLLVKQLPLLFGITIGLFDAAPCQEVAVSLTSGLAERELARRPRSRWRRTAVLALLTKSAISARRRPFVRTSPDLGKDEV